MAIGLKNAYTVFLKYPAIVLTPTFSFWTIGPIDNCMNSRCGYSGIKSLRVSYFHTWVNIFITSAGSIAFIFMCLKWEDRILWDGTIGIPGWIVFPIYIFGGSGSMLLLILIDRCMKCCCIHCQDNCFPATELVIYNAQDDINEDKHNLDKNPVGVDNTVMVEISPNIVAEEIVSNPQHNIHD